MRLRTEFEISPDIDEPYAVIHAEKRTPELQSLADTIERYTESARVIAAKKDDRIFVLSPEDIQIVRTENDEMAAYDSAGERFTTDKRLYEAEMLLGDACVRISKSAIVNIRKISHVEASFNGMLNVMMKNGVTEYISRRYVSRFKKRLGL
jgi:DNA-binding LytR/AlgR family response regulator